MKNKMKVVKGWSVLARDQKIEALWIAELKTLQRSVGDALGKWVHAVQEQMNPLLLVDARKEGWQEWVQNLNRDEVSVFLVIDEKDFLPEAEMLEKVDDVLVYPFRMAELLSKCRSHHLMKIHQQQEIELKEEILGAKEVIRKTNEILGRVVNEKTPKRFHHMKGIKVMSKHLSGLKPGGDYFDVFESDKKDFVNFLLVDSSSYGVSSALLGMILSSSAKMANDTQMSAGAWIQAIYQELKITLGEKDHLSVFFGRLNKIDLTLHYQLHGSIEVFVMNKMGECQSLEKQGKKINGLVEPERKSEHILHLNPKDRLILLSDGFVNGLGGTFYLQKIFHEKIDHEPVELVNELAFQIRSKLVSGETFPGEDCSAMVIDIESRGLRLAPTG